MRFTLFIALIFICGCTTMDHSALVSPSESLYHNANKLYENKDFDQAIALYEKFLEAKPRSDLAVPAKLNLGMSYYYSGNYKEAYATLKGIDITDENIKDYITDILKICEAETNGTIEPETQTQMAQALNNSPGGQIKIRVFDAYLDNFGSVVLRGETNRVLTVLVDGAVAPLDGNNIFTASARWKKGSSILIVAKDDSGNRRELDYYPDGESPDRPEGLSVINVTSNSAEIEWSRNYEDDIKGYRLFHRLRGGSTREVSGIIERTRHEIVGLQSHTEGANKTFEFFVRAVDKMDNESDDSDILEVTLP